MLVHSGMCVCWFLLFCTYALPVYVRHTVLLLLQEVDNWTALVADVDEVFASQDVSMMASRIQGMQHSLVRTIQCMPIGGRAALISCTLVHSL